MAKKVPVIKDKTELPITLEPYHIRAILSSDKQKPMGERQLYDFLNDVERMDRPHFPIIRVGRLLKIPRDPFFDWFEGRRQVG